MRFVTTIMVAVYAALRRRIKTARAVDSARARRHGRTVQLGVLVRNMGPASAPETVLAAARAADEAPGIADLWVTDHIAIPPDDAEGAGGRYLDPLATLATVAGAPTPIGRGPAGPLLPPRPAPAPPHRG